MRCIVLALTLLMVLTVPALAAPEPPPEPPDPTGSTVDPRLREPLLMLAEVRDRNGQAVGQQYTAVMDGMILTLAVGELGPGLAGQYTPATHTVTIGEAALAEDQRFVATALAHELKHADDADLVGLGLLDADCVGLEARGFEAQVLVARAFWPDGLPRRTDFEQSLAGLVDLYGQGGLDALTGWVGQHPGYQQMCASAGLPATSGSILDEFVPVPDAGAL
jgi:hypothetical protein